MACFLPSWYKFYCVLARSRYKFDRSREVIPGYKFGSGHWRSVAVQTISEPKNCHGILDFNCVQMSVSGCNGHYKFVLSAGAKAKSVTNNLPILSVLGAGVFYFVKLFCFSFCDYQNWILVYIHFG